MADTNCVASRKREAARMECIFFFRQGITQKKILCRGNDCVKRSDRNFGKVSRIQQMLLTVLRAML